MRLIAIMVCFLVSSIFASVQAQDIIVLKDGQRIKAKISEVNDNEIKYYEYADQDGILFSIDRATIREIRYEFGKKEKEVSPDENKIYYVDDKRQNIKLNFTAIGGATTILTYERALNLYSSFEVSAKINGLGVNNDNDKSGFGLNAAYKIKLGSVVKDKDEYRPKHLMHGTYLRPNIGFNTVNQQDFADRAIGYTYVNLGIDIGKQWVMQNALVLDLYIGLHYYGGDTESTNQGDIFDIETVSDGDFFGANNVASTFGLRIGGLFGKGIGSK